MRWLHLLPLATCLLAQTPPVLRTTPAERVSLDVTLYHPYSGEVGSHQGFGLLREVRRIRVPRGTFTLQWQGLPKEVAEESAQLDQASGAPRLRSLERNYDQNLLTSRALRAASLGLPIRVERRGQFPSEGRLRSLPASGDGQLVVETQEGLEAVPEPAVQLTRWPEGLFPEPTLSALLESDAEGEVELRLTLLVERMRWTAHYNVDLSEDFTRGRLEGYALLENRSGMAFEGARLALVAGPVARVGDAHTWDRMDLRNQAPPPAQAVVEVVASAALEPLGETHLFHWPRAFTLEAFQTKQLALFSRPGVRIEPRVHCFAPLGRGWSEEDLQAGGAYLQLEVFNLREDEASGPWPEGEWTLRLSRPQGPPLLIQEPASSIPVGASQVFTSDPLRIWAHSRLVRERRPWWGPHAREETWEVKVGMARPAQLPGPAFLELGLLENQEVAGPEGLKHEGFTHRLPLDLSPEAPVVHRFTIRYPKRPSP